MSNIRLFFTQKILYLILQVCFLDKITISLCSAKVMRLKEDLSFKFYLIKMVNGIVRKFLFQKRQG